MQSFLRIQQTYRIMKKNKGKQQLLIYEGNKLIYEYSKMYGKHFQVKKKKKENKWLSALIHLSPNPANEKWTTQKPEQLYLMSLNDQLSHSSFTAE